MQVGEGPDEWSRGDYLGACKCRRGSGGRLGASVRPRRVEIYGTWCITGRHFFSHVTGRHCGENSKFLGIEARHKEVMPGSLFDSWRSGMSAWKSV